MNSPTRRRLLLAAGALGMTPLAHSREPGWSVQTGHLPPFVIAGPVRPAGALFEVVQALLQAVGEEPTACATCPTARPIFSACRR